MEDIKYLKEMESNLESRLAEFPKFRTFLIIGILIGFSCIILIGFILTPFYALWTGGTAGEAGSIKAELRIVKGKIDFIENGSITFEPSKGKVVK